MAGAPEAPLHRPSAGRDSALEDQPDGSIHIFGRGSHEAASWRVVCVSPEDDAQGLGPSLHLETNSLVAANVTPLMRCVVSNDRDHIGSCSLKLAYLLAGLSKRALT